MPLNTASINDNATAMTPTGGAAISFASMGIVDNTNKLYVTSDTSLKTRRYAEVSVKEPKANANSIGGYTQARAKVKLVFPRTLTIAGATQITLDTLTMELARDISATDAEVQNYLFLGSQVLGDADFQALFKALNLS